MAEGGFNLFFRHSPHPLLFPTVALIAGIALDARLSPAGPVWTAIFAVAALSAPLAAGVGFPRLGAVALLIAAAAAGGLRHNVHWNHYPPNHPIEMLGAERRIAEFEGLVRLPPSIRPARTGGMSSPAHRGGRISFVLSAEKLVRPEGDLAVEGDIQMSVADPEGGGAPFTAGDRIRVIGTFSAPSPPDNPGEADWRQLLRRRRILLSGFSDSPRAVTVLPAERADPFHSWVASVRRAVRRPISESDLSADRKAFLRALLLGDREGLDEDLMDDFALTGTTYFIVVSGQNVGLVVVFVYWLARLFLGRRIAALPAFAALGLYVLVVDPQPPIVRAGIMAAVVLCAVLVSRRPQFLNSLALAAAIVLWLKPSDLFDAGFQLSFLCTLALVELGPRIHAALFERPDPEPFDPLRPPPTLGRRLRTAATWWFSLNLAAWIFSVPLTACLFQTASLANPIVSLVANPFACAAMVIGFFGVAIGAVLPAVGNVLLILAAVFGDLFVAWIRAAAGVTALHLHVLGVSALSAILAYVVLTAWLIRRRLELSRLRIGAAFAALAAFHFVGNLRFTAEPTLRCAILSVGHGTCVVGDDGVGSAWIGDAGSLRAADPGRTVLRPYLAHRRLGDADLLMLSHPDLDHFSGVPTLLKRTPVAAVAGNPYFERLCRGRGPAEELLGALARHNRTLRPLKRGDVVELNAHTVARVLWPPAGLSSETARLTTNDTSLVVRIEHGGYSILLTGDIGPTVQAVLAEDPGIRADVLLMPHHGSTVGDPEGFVAAVAPAVVVISNDAGRSVKSDRMLERLRRRTTVLHTAEAGAVEIAVAGGRLTAGGFLGGAKIELDRPRFPPPPSSP